MHSVIRIFNFDEIYHTRVTAICILLASLYLGSGIAYISAYNCTIRFYYSTKVKLCDPCCLSVWAG